jgi:GSCFA family
MAIEIISGEDAWSKTQQKNKQKKWPSQEQADRLYPIATPITQATFKIHPDEKIFCIGSCFAGELSQALHRLDYKVLSIFRDLPKSASRKHFDDSMFYKYNVASIYNELSWALNPDTPYQHDYALIETSTHGFQDCHLVGQSYSSDELEFAKIFREAFNLAFSKVKEADVMILTLGLSEVWFDKQTQLYLNIAVSPSLIRKHPQRFELHVFDYMQTLSFLNAIYDLLKTHLKPSFRLLITVSPIPLAATFRQQDVLIANTYSKALLRTAVEAFVIDKSNVNYFPSYEFVTLSNPLVVWDNDLRHVDNTFVEYIMGNVMAQFTDAVPTIHEANLLLKVKLLYRGNFLNEAKLLLKSLIKNQTNPDKELFVLWGTMQLGIYGKYKLFWLKAWTQFKTYHHLSVSQSIKKLFNHYRVLSNKAVRGHVELWDGQYLRGWAIDFKRTTPIKIKVLVDNRVVATALADLQRADVADIHGENHLYCGFYMPLNCKQLGSHVVRVIFADTSTDLTGSPIYSENVS